MDDLGQERLTDIVGDSSPEVRYFDEVDSTNAVAAQWAFAGAQHGSLVVAESQTAGRGRLDRTWFARESESLLVSLIVRPKSIDTSVPLISLAAAAAVHSTLFDVQVGSEVKWPNDVMIEGRKVAGILCESGSGEHGPHVIVGVGINVNVYEFPGGLGSSATSLLMQTNTTFDRGLLLAFFVRHFNELFAHFPEGIVDIYKVMCETLGKKVNVQMADGSIEGIAVDIDKAGGLVLDTGVVVRAGDVTHLR